MEREVRRSDGVMGLWRKVRRGDGGVDGKGYGEDGVTEMTKDGDNVMNCLV